MHTNLYLGSGTHSAYSQSFRRIFVVLFSCIWSSLSIATTNWDGSVELEQRYFWEKPPNIETSHGQSSARLQMEFFKDWNGGKDQIVFEPFLRIDEQDSERSHIDIRQLIWSHLSDNWEFSAGVGRVFWGVTESKHLVDIVNQTDGVENIDGEDKLGQPMLRHQYFSNYGTIETFLLPYFRGRTFAGRNSRLNGGVIVDNDKQNFESNHQKNNIDFAIRYINTIADWGLGLSWFHGTSREPDLFRSFDNETLSTIPFYPQIDQFGVDIQFTTGALLVKLEAIQRDFSSASHEDFAATTIGFEYTIVGVFNSVYDLGILAEYSWDQRGERATGILQDDLFVGTRIALNDISSSEILFGLTNDLDDSSSMVAFVEASTRIGSSLTANLELRFFDSDDPNDLLFRFRDHSFVQIGLEYFFD